MHFWPATHRHHRRHTCGDFTVAQVAERRCGSDQVADDAHGRATVRVQLGVSADTGVNFSCVPCPAWCSSFMVIFHGRRVVRRGLAGRCQWAWSGVQVNAAHRQLSSLGAQ